MKNKFTNIVLLTKPEDPTVINILNTLVELIQKRNAHTISLEAEAIDEHCDLVIVIGGDGSLLKAARTIIDYHIPLVGINHGQLGFMVDVSPQKMHSQINAILDGEYIENERCLLCTELIDNEQTISSNSALNDVVLHSGDIARMLEFDVFIDNQFVMRQRSDGMIVATPTGSTAHALSAGGPILYPTLSDILLVPICPHTLTSRPLVVHKNSSIRLVTIYNKFIQPKLSFDGQIHVSLTANSEVKIKRHKNKLKLIYPKDYNYFSLLREKLGWNTYGGNVLCATTD